jgi:predicted N-acetyltransferase YhbS
MTAARVSPLTGDVADATTLSLTAFHRELDATMTLPLDVRPITAEDGVAVEALHDRVSGPGRFAKASYRVREGLAGHSNWCLGAWTDGQLVAAIRFTPITIGRQRGPLLLGPLAVDMALKGQGIGKGLVALGLERATAGSVPLVVLVGDRAYYERFGFKPVPKGQIVMPGPVDPARLLVRSLHQARLAQFASQFSGQVWGMVECIKGADTD